MSNDSALILCCGGFVSKLSSTDWWWWVRKGDEDFFLFARAAAAKTCMWHALVVVVTHHQSLQMTQAKPEPCLRITVQESKFGFIHPTSSGMIKQYNKCTNFRHFGTSILSGLLQQTAATAVLQLQHPAQACHIYIYAYIMSFLEERVTFADVAVCVGISSMRWWRFWFRCIYTRMYDIRALLCSTMCYAFKELHHTPPHQRANRATQLLFYTKYFASTSYFSYTTAVSNNTSYNISEKSALSVVICLAYPAYRYCCRWHDNWPQNNCQSAYRYVWMRLYTYQQFLAWDTTAVCCCMLQQYICTSVLRCIICSLICVEVDTAHRCTTAAALKLLLSVLTDLLNINLKSLGFGVDYLLPVRIDWHS